MSIVVQGKDIHSLADVNIRLAEIHDALLLWKWANDPVTRRNSFNSEPIPWDVHQSWCAKKLASLDCRLWIMELEKIAVGQIRYDRISADTGQISFSVAPFVRGRGLGTLLLEMTVPMAARDLGLKWVKGIALNDNHASQRAFVKAGFKVSEHQGGNGRECVVFQRSCECRRVAES
jgi:RimJ/RimL family protein N-acetyltransferase